jgi:hypothetical protein
MCGRFTATAALDVLAERFGITVASAKRAAQRGWVNRKKRPT